MDASWELVYFPARRADVRSSKVVGIEATALNVVGANNSCAILAVIPAADIPSDHLLVSFSVQFNENL